MLETYKAMDEMEIRRKVLEKNGGLGKKQAKKLAEKYFPSDDEESDDEG